MQDFLVGGRFAHAHVERDLADPRDLHRRLVAKLLRERRGDFLLLHGITKGLEPTIRMRKGESPSDVLPCLPFHNTCTTLDQPCFVFLEIRSKNP